MAPKFQNRPGSEQRSPEIAPANVNLFSYKAHVWAEQLTLLEHDLLRMIPPLELINKAFTRPELSPNWHIMVRHYNNVASWTVYEIVSRKDIEQRAKAASRMIHIAKECLDRNNFNTASAILGGLNGAAVSRLQLTWERVDRKTKARYKELMRVFSMHHNYKNYREAFANAKPPIVPYIALMGKWLFALEENNPSLLFPLELVNWDKMRHVWRIVADHQRCCSDFYNFPIVKEARSYLKHFQPLTDDQAYELSQAAEPPKREKL